MPEEDKTNPNAQFGMRPGETEEDFDFDVNKDGVGPTSKDKRTTWDGETIEAGAWYDEELFKVGDLKVTPKEAIGLSGGVIAAIAIGSAVCLYISWRKREAIAEGARRLSTVISRSATYIRRTIVGHPRDADGNFIDEEVDPATLTNDRRQVSFLRSMFAFHNDASPVKKDGDDGNVA